MENSITSLFQNFNHWSWWIFALALFIVELIAPGVFFLWFGIAATITGAVVWALPTMGWEVDFGIFAVVGVASALLGRRYWRPGKIESADPTLNRRGDQYLGQVFTLETAIENGRGRMKVGDGGWLVEGPDLPAGTKVRVIHVDGARLVVEPAH